MSTLARLSWKILEAKYFYYLRDTSIMPDHEYDEMERYYEDLCSIYGVEPSASRMVGYDKNKPSCQLVMLKMQNNRKPLK